MHQTRLKIYIFEKKNGNVYYLKRITTKKSLKTVKTLLIKQVLLLIALVITSDGELTFSESTSFS